jgi:uncharacterized membrane protein YhhN
MKASIPSLILYFSACVATVLFNLTEQESLLIFAKSMVVPSIFIYYLITNNYKIDLIKTGIFLFSFIGDVFILMKYDHSETGSILSFLIVYLLIIILFVRSFKNVNLNKLGILSLLGVMIIIAYLSITILSLQFEKMKTDFTVIIIYSIVLSIVICFSVINYIIKSSYAFLNLVIMSICFLLSDVFYILNAFYLSLSTFSLIETLTQVFSYYFMVNYFIENDKAQKN